MIINPRSIRPDGTIDPADKTSMISKPAGQRCPHLAFLGEVAVCTIHELPCYRATPCDRFDTICPEDGVCVISGYLRSLRSAKL